MSAFTGTLRLVRLALRRDRIQLPIWLVGMAAGLTASATAILDTYPTQADRVAAATLLANNPATLVLRGPAANASTGALIMNDALWILGVLAALMSIFAVVRHTRQNEETGRAELIGAAPVGRHAGLAAALIVTVGANVALAVLLALVLILKGLPVEGSFAAGSAIGAIGIAFAGIAAIAVQFSESARGARGLAGAVLAVTYLLRGAGDALGEVEAGGVTAASAWPSWFSPIGWGQRIRPFGGNDWWVLGLFAASFAVMLRVAFVLTARRDFGLGMIPARRGPAVAPRSLLSPLGLAWRLQRGTLLGWAIGMVVAGGLFGSVGKQAQDLLKDNAQFAETLSRLGGAGAGFVDSFFAAMFGIMGAISAGYALQALLQLHAEESGGRLEPILATAVSRPRWMLSHIIVGVIGVVTLILLLGLATGIAYVLVAGEPWSEAGTLIGAALVQAPAVLALAGFVIAAFGLLPRWAVALAWAGLTASAVLGPLGEILGLPQWAMDLSPFTHSPAAPAEAVTVMPVVTLLAIAIALSTAGLLFFRRRNYVF